MARGRNLSSQGVPKIACSYGKLCEGHETDSPSVFLKRTNPADTLILDSWPQDSERMNFCYFVPSISFKITIIFYFGVALDTS